MRTNLRNRILAFPAFLGIALAGCVAQQDAMLKGHANLHDGQGNILKAMEDATGADLKDVRAIAERAAKDARQLAVAAQERKDAFSKLGTFVEGIATRLDSTGFLSTTLSAVRETMDKEVEKAKREMASEVAATEDALAAKVEVVEAKGQAAEARMMGELTVATSDVQRQVDLLKAGLDQAIAEKFSTLSKPLQDKLAAGATTENLESLKKALDESEDAFDAKLAQTMDVTKAEVGKMREAGLSSEEIMQLLAALIATGGLSTVAARKLSNSGARIDGIERQLNSQSGGGKTS